MGSFIQKYKENSLPLPDESRIFYDPETIDFFKKFSLKMKKEEYIKFENGDLNATPDSQIHKAKLKYINYLSILEMLLTPMYTKCLDMLDQTVSKNSLFSSI